AGEKPAHIGVVLAGLLHIVREDCNGSRALIAAAAPGELFAEALCCAGVAESPVTVLASESAKVLLLRFDRILHTCPSACSYHQKLVENMLNLVAVKNLQLQDRMELLAAKSIRDKVLLYLGALASGQGRTVTVPFNREELAEYLCVERSALSHALMKMKREGLIEYKKNVFTLLFSLPRGGA
ncbi:MAG: Crp/Fnr family transcriptional regulator, partial [Firmicutes bacterium]|nr:Crp/Fnr family transcriptional regulator [Bacillota bacterium]